MFLALATGFFGTAATFPGIGGAPDKFCGYMEIVSKESMVLSNHGI
jgi:hypothetical protein